MPTGRLFPVSLSLVGLAGCEGHASWLAGGGAEALAIEKLFWPLVIGGGVIWTVVMTLAILAARMKPGQGTPHRARQLILWGGAVFTTVVVLSLLIFGSVTLRAIAVQTPDETVHVDGEQWWWRVTYDTPEGTVVSANELRLPAGRTTRFRLTSDDVIHSFWVPALGGKMDMIPGRETSLPLTPEAPGRWTGICAEYCGGAHAQMRFSVEVMAPEAFEDWLADEAQPAAVTSGEGLEVFLSNGCGACHTVRGTEAQGKVGPDLTHLASRHTLGAGLLPMTREALARWITRTGEVKPGVKMPSYPQLSGSELSALTGFLMRLE